MISVNIAIDNYTIRNLDKNDLEDMLFCINESDENLEILGMDELLTTNYLKQRYIETLINSLEYFCGIYDENGIIGMVKGRIENKNPRELWILSFLIMEKYRGKGIGTKLLFSLEEYFLNNFGIMTYCILLNDYNQRSKSFWQRSKYKLVRISRNKDNDKEVNMVILEKRRL